MNKVNCILIIDDNDATSFLNEEMLAEMNVAEYISVAVSAEDALEYLKETDKSFHPTPEVIFLDLNMPGMTGWEFLDYYASLNHEDMAQVLVLLSSSTNPDDILRGKNHPVVDFYFTKPLNVEKVNEALSCVKKNLS